MSTGVLCYQKRLRGGLLLSREGERGVGSMKYTDSNVLENLSIGEVWSADEFSFSVSDVLVWQEHVCWCGRNTEGILSRAYLSY